MFCLELRLTLYCFIAVCKRVTWPFFKNSLLVLVLRHLLGLQPSAQFRRITNSEIAKLVYRDNINLKHGPRKRLAKELEVKMAAGDDAPALRDKKVKEVKTPNPLSKALTDYLLQVHWI